MIRTIRNFLTLKIMDTNTNTNINMPTEVKKVNVMKEEKIELGIDSLAFEYAQKLDTQLFQDVRVLDAIIENTIGVNVVDDYQALLDNPVEYLSQLYWSVYGDKFPANANRVQTFIRQSAHTQSKFVGLTDSIKDGISKLRTNQPIINGGSIASGLMESNFTITVHTNKVKLYKLIKSVLKNHQAIKDLYPISMEFQLLRQYNPMLETRGGMLRPSRTFFSKS